MTFNKIKDIFLKTYNADLHHKCFSIATNSFNYM